MIADADEQTLPITSPKDVDVATSATAEPKLDSSRTQVETDGLAHKNKTTTWEPEEKEETASDPLLHEELAKMQKGVEEWKMAYEEQSKKVEAEKSWLYEIHIAYVNSQAKLKERQREGERRKNEYMA
ncbi:hypothetical protein G6011_04826 [Alternaria panax]|uniref:Uncharacterized protein n=1 Tax=Alternaria panax TaxID=48097 RepID=A0AAD4II28_9PLEO|nr:hypothetical protein G6011_04826 [Alternaria panax]